MLGDSLLVAPVFHDSQAKFYLPSGKWTDFWTDEVVQGPKWIIRDDYPIDLIPVFVKAGSVLLLGPEGVDVPDYDYAKVELEVRTYQLGQKAQVKVPDLKGGWAGSVTVGPDGQFEAGKFKLVGRK